MTTQSAKVDDIYCIGCGTGLQVDSPQDAGYVPASALQKESDQPIYCKRCFRLRHYNEISDVELTKDDFLSMLHEISDRDALIVNVIDIVDNSGSMIPGIQRFAGNNPVFLVANKVDLLPSSVKLNQLKNWVLKEAHMQGIRPVDVAVISSKKSEDVKNLMQQIEEIRQGKDVYIVGATNVGKSTLINQIINIASSQSDMITTSYFPGTTLGKIEIPLEDGSYLVDTPGIINRGHMSHLLSQNEMKYIIPQKRLKPTTFQLTTGQSVWAGGLVRIDLVDGNFKQSLTGYFSNTLPLHRTKTERADAAYESLVGSELKPPLKDTMEKWQSYPLVKKQIHLEKPTDIVISGLGWFYLKETPVQVDIWAPKGIDIYQRRPMIGKREG